MATTYYISTGSKSRMFTLRSVTETPEKVTDVHVRNLSNNREIAIAKAAEIVGHEIEITDAETSPIARGGSYQDMPNGKYAGINFREINDMKYLEWWVERYSSTKTYAKLVAEIRTHLAVFINNGNKQAAEKAVAYTVVDFGKHKGTPVADLPQSYLEYMADNCYAKIPRLAFANELKRRANAAETETEPVQESGNYLGTNGKSITADIAKAEFIDYIHNNTKKVLTKLTCTDGNIIIYYGAIGDWWHEPSVKKVWKFDGTKMTEANNFYKDLTPAELYKSEQQMLPFHLGGDFLYRNCHELHDADADGLLSESDIEILGNVTHYDTYTGLFLEAETSERKLVQDFTRPFRITAKVKEHHTRNGVKQTVIYSPKIKMPDTADNCRCDGCGRMYHETDIKLDFGKFNVCNDCKNNPDINFA